MQPRRLKQRRRTPRYRIEVWHPPSAARQRRVAAGCIILQFLSATSALISQCKAENRKAAVIGLIAAGLIDRRLMEKTSRSPFPIRITLVCVYLQLVG